MRLTEIRIAGFGGQGVILSAVVLGKAASIYENGFATMTQNFGPEARGGACSAQLVDFRLAGALSLCHSSGHHGHPVAGSIQPLRSELKPGGVLIVEEDLVRVSDLKGDLKVYSVPATRFAEELGKRMVLNSVLVGFFTAITKLLSADSVRKAVADSVPPLPRIKPESFRQGISVRQFHGSARFDRELEELTYSKE